LLQRGCNRGGECGNTSPSSFYIPVDCMIRSRRLSGRRGAGGRWEITKERVIIIERDHWGRYPLVRLVERYKVKWGSLVL